MRRLSLPIVASLLIAGCSQVRDRQSIEALLESFNRAVSRNDSKALHELFVSGADLSAIENRPPKRLPWDERTALTLSVKSIDVSNFGAAEVEAIQGDSMPMTGVTRRWTCRMHLKRTWRGWKIASYQESPETNTAAPGG
jgi:hypothetical protein